MMGKPGVPDVPMMRCVKADTCRWRNECWHSVDHEYDTMCDNTQLKRRDCPRTCIHVPMAEARSGPGGRRGGTRHAGGPAEADAVNYLVDCVHEFTVLRKRAEAALKKYPRDERLVDLHERLDRACKGLSTAVVAVPKDYWMEFFNRHTKC